MDIVESLLRSLEALALSIPIEIFVALGSFIEEVAALIPSPAVMVLTGSLAVTQNYAFWYLGVLAIIGAVGKTLGSWLLYFLADKLEDVVVGKFGRFLGVSHKEIESIGKKLKGGWQDNVFLFIARAIPIIPSAPVSIACGVIKLDQKTFLTSTFAGTFVKNLMYLYLGYAGLGNYREISGGFEGLESLGQLTLLAVIVALIGWAYYKRSHTKHA